MVVDDNWFKGLYQLDYRLFIPLSLETKVSLMSHIEYRMGDRLNQLLEVRV